MDKVLITGGLGQDGKILSNILKKECVILTDFDIRDVLALENSIKEHRPDYFINFAGLSSNAKSWENPVDYINVNSISVISQLEAIRKFAPECKYFNAGTILQLKNEYDQEFSPRTPYAASKCLSHWFVDFYRQKYGLNCCQGILSNHESHLRTRGFLSYDVCVGAKRIKGSIENGREFEPIYIKNVNSIVDWSSAEDVVRQIWENLQKDKLEDFLIINGEKKKVKDLIEEIFEELNIEGYWDGLDYILSGDYPEYCDIKNLILVKGGSKENKKIKPIKREFPLTRGEKWSNLREIVKSILNASQEKT